MPTWSWKKIIWRVAGLVLISFFLALLTDFLFMALQPVGRFDQLNDPIAPESINLASPEPLSTLTSEEAARNEAARKEFVLDALKTSAAPGEILERNLACRLLENRLEGEYVLVVARTSLLAQKIRAGEFDYQISSFIPVLFGELSIDGAQVLQDFAASDMSWSEDSAAGTLTLTVRFEREISRFTSLRLSRNEAQNALPAGQDQFHVSFANWRAVSVRPASDFASGAMLSYDLNKHQGERIQFEAASIWPTSTPLAAATPAPSATQAAVEKEDIFTRQEFMQKLDDVLAFAPIGSILFSLVEALPLLLFCWLAWRWKFSEVKWAFYDNLLFLTLGLLIFHFSFYFLSGLSSGWYSVHDSQPVEYLSNSIERFITPFFHFFHKPLFGFGYYWSGVALLGVMLPLLMLELGKEIEFQNERGIYFIPALMGVWKKKPGKAGWWLARLLTWIILLLLVAAPLPVLYAQLNQPPYQVEPALWMLTLPLLGILGMLLWISWRGLYRRLNGNSPAAKPAYLALFALLAIAVYENLYLGIGIQANRPLGVEISWGWFIVNTLLGLLLVYSFARVTLAAFNRTMWLTGSRGRRWAWGLGLLFLVIPMQSLLGESRLADQFGLFSLGAYLDDLIKFIWLAGLVYIFHRNGTNGPAITPFTRLAGILAGTVVLVRHTQEWFYVPVTFLVCLFMFNKFIKPAGYWDELKQYYEKVFNERISLLEEIVRLNTAERSYQDLHKEYSTKLGKGEIDYKAFHEKIELRRKELDVANENARVNDQPYRDIALTFGPKETAWENGLHGAVWGLILALPWIGIGLFDYLTGAVSGTYPLLGLLRDLLNLAARWVGLGFILGYFYPYLRGKNGLMKALGLWLVAIVPSIPLALIYNSSTTSWQAFLFLVLQLLVHCILLGLIAFDFMTLRQGYREWQMLFEVHGLPSLGVSASTFVISLATSVFTLMQGQAGEILKAFIALIVPAADKITLP